MMIPTKDIRGARNCCRSSGFSLTEMLVTVLILGIMTTLLTSAITFATEQQKRSVFYAQASTLQSTIDNALADPLRFATYEAATGEYTISYRGHEAIKDSNPQLVVGDGEEKSGVYSLDADELVANPTLQKGQLYLTGKYAGDTNKTVYVKLLNSGAYGGSPSAGGNTYANCEVVIESGANALSIAPPDPAAGKDYASFIVRFRVKSSLDDNLMAGTTRLDYRTTNYEKGAGSL